MNNINNSFIYLVLNDLILKHISEYVENKDLHNIYKTNKLLLPIRQFCYWNLNYYYSDKYCVNLEFRIKIKNLIKYPNKNLSLNLFFCNISNDIRDLSILSNIHSIKFGNSFRKSYNNFPNSISQLTFGTYFIINHLPDSLTHLSLGYFLKQPIDKLPNSITNLTLRNPVNKLIDNLPNSITHLILKDYFIQPIDNLPKSIKHLFLLDSFNHSIDNLPNSITHLVIGNKFNQSIDNLPDSITHLVIGNKFNQPINKLPKSLIELKTINELKFNNKVSFSNIIMI